MNKRIIKFKTAQIFENTEHYITSFGEEGLEKVCTSSSAKFKWSLLKLQFSMLCRSIIPPTDALNGLGELFSLLYAESSEKSLLETDFGGDDSLL